MEVPVEFWKAVGSAITLVSVMYALYLASRIYNNVWSAHKKHITTTVEYKGCNIYPEKMDVHNH